MMNKSDFMKLLELADLEGHDKAVSIFRSWDSACTFIPAVAGPTAIWLATYFGTHHTFMANLAAGLFVFLQFIGFLNHHLKPQTIIGICTALGGAIGYFGDQRGGMFEGLIVGLFTGIGSLFVFIAVEFVYFVCRPVTYTLLYLLRRHLQGRIAKETPAWYSPTAKLVLTKYYGALFYCYNNRIFVGDKKERQNGQAAANGVRMYTQNELYARGILYGASGSNQGWSNDDDGSGGYQPPMVNPASGLPMMGSGMGGFDVGGNTWGSNNGI